MYCSLGFPDGSDGKESACNAGDWGSIPGLGRTPSEGNGYPLQYSCLENSMGRGCWWATVDGLQRVGHNWHFHCSSLPVQCRISDPGQSLSLFHSWAMLCPPSPGFESWFASHCPSHSTACSHWQASTGTRRLNTSVSYCLTYSSLSFRAVFINDKILTRVR